MTYVRVNFSRIYETLIINVSLVKPVSLISTDLDCSAHIVVIVVAVICIATPQDQRLLFHNLDRRLKHS